jgi:23S rRNA pseudouridine1911/1915/1917 synthase
MTIGPRHFRVNSQCELLPFLLNLPLGLSRKQAKDLLRFHAVEVLNKTAIRHDTQLSAGDLITIASPKDTRDSPPLNGLKIVHSDEAVIVVDKPAGLLSMGSNRDKHRTVHRILNEHLKAQADSKEQQAFIIHRLDRETSGLMVFARSEGIQALMQSSWQGVTKRYLAAVAGVFDTMEGTFKDNLLESKSLLVHRVARGGEVAITHYRVIGQYIDKSLLELTLETGRKHQIRVQLAARGHPVLGDRKYGPRTDLTTKLALHSCELRFQHPVSHLPMHFRSPIPARMRALTRPSPNRLL